MKSLKQAFTPQRISKSLTLRLSVNDYVALYSVGNGDPNRGLAELLAELRQQGRIR